MAAARARGGAGLRRAMSAAQASAWQMDGMYESPRLEATSTQPGILDAPRLGVLSEEWFEGPAAVSAAVRVWRLPGRCYGTGENGADSGAARNPVGVAADGRPAVPAGGGSPVAGVQLAAGSREVHAPDTGAGAHRRGPATFHILTTCGTLRRDILLLAEYVFLPDPWWNPAVKAQVNQFFEGGRIADGDHAKTVLCSGSLETKLTLAAADAAQPQAPGRWYMEQAGQDVLIDGFLPGSNKSVCSWFASLLRFRM